MRTHGGDCQAALGARLLATSRLVVEPATVRYVMRPRSCDSARAPSRTPKWPPPLGPARAAPPLTTCGGARRGSQNSNNRHVYGTSCRFGSICAYQSDELSNIFLEVLHFCRDFLTSTASP